MRIVGLLITILALLGAAAPAKVPKREGPAGESVLRPAARIVGIAEGGSYAKLPEVHVDLGSLPRGAGIWVEAYRGGARKDARGVNLPSHLVRRAGGQWALRVPGIERCAGEGTWTVQVLMSSGARTRLLDRKTFHWRPHDAALDPNKILNDS